MNNLDQSVLVRLLKGFYLIRNKQKEARTMNTILKVAIIIGMVFMAGTWVNPAFSATNQATDPGGGGVLLTASGAVTVNSTALQLVKQVWTAAGACLASSPSDATCNGGATSVTVAAGTALKFVIFVKNSTTLALSDVRFQDTLDITATGFNYVTNSIKYNASQLDTATSAQIYTAVDAGTPETDAVDAGAGNYASVTGGSVLTVGAVVGQVNATLNVAANRTFAIEFQATKR
jgi:hypothetical protein